MKLCILASCRPNIIKQYGIIKECIKQNIDYYILHTGQHYSDNMSKNFFEELGLPRENINLGVTTSDRVERLSEIARKCKVVFQEFRPDMVILQGDTDSDYMVAVTAKLMGIKIVHNEAGIRSDSDIPEEYNRRMIDHIADVLWCPTIADYKRLEREGVMGDFYITGNTVYDCISNVKPLTHDERMVIYGDTKKYIYLTIHRNTNTDDASTLYSIISQIHLFAEKEGYEIKFYCHPRTKKMIEEFGYMPLLQHPIRWLCDPIGYSDNINAIKNASIVITDSGGVQEECSILGKRCIVVRDSTERPFEGSVLRRGDICKAYEEVKDVFVDMDKFNPIGLENISEYALSLVL